MTRKKSSKKAILPVSSESINLRAMFNQLPKIEQENVTNFFNCHNVAISIFSQLSQAAQEYINTCIEFTHNMNKQEAAES